MGQVEAAQRKGAGADALLFEPETDYSYSSYGWNLISAVMEGASGQEFLTFMRAIYFAGNGSRAPRWRPT